ncbi:flavin reductase family protein [Flavimaricola marinus]|uniref:p-hydroxyphenylacetate 3-hydroxylase, reductase component n=1 Tax=Flavimaricola marinus TaxID=1819565 RepID=A0A238LED2_9RHOB|nr:flavin reductase family protein [Flavimaricola marinus]SMY08039.1 p-hydroxyphenylacetate 3-hydroxylase, reductase component [Flavimaricola marinus]
METTPVLDSSPEFDPRALRDAFGQFASGITVVSLLDGDGRPTGVTVSSFSSLSLEPALCLFSLGKSQMSCKWIDSGNGFNINILSAEQEASAWQFAKPLEDKFDGVEWYAGRNALPVLKGSLCHFECAKWNVYDGGDHIIVVGQITHFERGDGDPLLFYRGKMATVAE